MDQQFAREIELLHDRVCMALSDPTRLLILYTLHQHPYNVSELVQKLNVPQPTISRHLKVLRERSLVEARRQGAAVFYSLGDVRVIQALELLRAFLHDRVLEQARLTDFPLPCDEEEI
ncbi:MAG: metalloregulator ArsR/SmtB family transcription factor [Aggregatilineales bacterium]